MERKSPRKAKEDQQTRVSEGRVNYTHSSASFIQFDIGLDSI